jgi:hypothetical protein
MCKVGVRGELFLFVVVMDVARCHVKNSTYNASCTNKKWNIYGLDIMDESITNLLKKKRSEERRSNAGGRKCNQVLSQPG